MSFTRPELERCINEVQTETSTEINFDLTHKLVHEFEKLKANLPRRTRFTEVLRFALNECCIQNKESRSLYSKVIGKLYGSHGGRKAAKNRRDGIPPKKQQKRSSADMVIVEPSGQLAFRI